MTHEEMIDNLKLTLEEMRNRKLVSSFDIGQNSPGAVEVTVRRANDEKVLVVKPASEVFVIEIENYYRVGPYFAYSDTERPEVLKDITDILEKYMNKQYYEVFYSIGRRTVYKELFFVDSKGRPFGGPLRGKRKLADRLNGILRRKSKQIVRP